MLLPDHVSGPDAFVQRMLGNHSEFFEHSWRRKPFFVESAGSEYANKYDAEAFFADLKETQPAPYIGVGTDDGYRVFKKCPTIQELRQVIAEGSVCAIKVSKLWHNRMPASWEWMRELFGSLCRAAAMVYMNPQRSEDVDLFLAGPSSGLGRHFDTTDVFTLQICGERRWVVDAEVQLDKVLATTGDPSWHPAQEIGFQTETREFVLRPGDSLYVPAYSVHQVSGVTWSVSLSLGLRAFNEIDFVDHLLQTIRASRYLSYAPSPSFPDSCEEQNALAKEELLQRVRNLARQLEGVALASLLSPLRLPADLQSDLQSEHSAHEDPRQSGMYRSAFALEERAVVPR